MMTSVAVLTRGGRVASTPSLGAMPLIGGIGGEFPPVVISPTGKMWVDEVQANFSGCEIVQPNFSGCEEAQVNTSGFAEIQ